MTLRELKDLCRAYQLAILFLMETRAHKERIERVKRSLKFKYYFCVEARGTAGGLGLFWGDNVDIQICNASQNFIDCVILDKNRNVDFDCSFVYGHPIGQQRRSLWGSLARFQLDFNRP